ncbi:uncharacterized protein LOC126694555 isoform X1 [Quercus robur]|uniref:uncharacterized protein LOC126694555 isoform X1 n=1 Tax=Quercus robur TaxID=38942 RepID=UPI0021623911|nr:uncharacterized protein LOC126694555 isoform X1 [Quercus robur]
MIQLLFTIVLAEMALIMTLLFWTPLRKLVIMGLDQLKQGRGPLVTKSVGGTLVVVFGSSIYSLMKIQKRSTDSGIVNPTDQVLMAYRHLEACLIGFSLFLALMIDRLHYYIRELQHLRKNLEMTKKLSQDSERLEMRKFEETNKPQVKQLESESKQSQNRQMSQKPAQGS